MLKKMSLKDILLVLISIILTGFATWTYFKLTNKAPEYNIEDHNARIYNHMDSLHRVRVKADSVWISQLGEKINRATYGINSIHRNIDDLIEEANQPIPEISREDFSKKFIELLDGEN